MEIEQISFDFEPARRVVTVSELTAAIRAALDAGFHDVWVAGEISGVKVSSSGHYYFTLKDGGAQLRCVAFRNAARLLKFKPQDGIAAVVRGRIDVYEARGEYQLLVETIEPQGYGALQLAFEQLKKKLAAEGLFDAGRKRPLPRLPGRIGIVTSPTGAVIRDMLHVLGRRLSGVHVRVYPAQVQGAGSVEEVVEGIDWFSASGWPDVVVVARGGGSLEDLWTFNEEAVARAIARCAVPVVSAVGHETDVTIADFVADLRAPTPSAAAELIVPTRRELLEAIDSRGERLERAARFRLTDAARRLHERGAERAASVVQRGLRRRAQGLDEIVERLRNLDPRFRLAAARRRLEAAAGVLAEDARRRVAGARARLDALERMHAALSPLAILERGYAIVEDAQGRIIKDAAAAPPKTLVDVRLARGSLRARVTRSTPAGSSALPS